MRTKNTVEKYNREGLRLIRFYKQKTGALDLSGFPEWLTAQKPSLRKNTWYLYKQSAMTVLRSLGEPDDMIEKLAKEGAEGCLGGRLPIKKALLERDVEKLRKAAKGVGNWNALAWLLAGRATGLRPVEWKNAKLEEGPEGPVLVVENAKHTNGRGNGPVRHLHLTELRARVLSEDPAALEAWEALTNHLANVKRAREKGARGFEKYYEACRQGLHRLSLLAGIKGISLYTSRHQFAADSKRAGHSHPQTAAEMGHASDRTAVTHYGRRVQGRPGTPLPLPSPEEVKTVRKKLGPSNGPHREQK